MRFSLIYTRLESQIYIFTLPSLDPVPINPIRNVTSFAVDNQHLLRPLTNEPISKVTPIEFSIIRRSGVGLFALREKLLFNKVRLV